MSTSDKSESESESDTLLGPRAESKLASTSDAVSSPKRRYPNRAVVRYTDVHRIWTTYGVRKERGTRLGQVAKERRGVGAVIVGKGRDGKWRYEEMFRKICGVPVGDSSEYLDS